ncbi:type II secretion system protein [Bacillus piscicola]|uniref:type II secretion system protein n=1 Tax=Bacillus piscicola TaxID=1632684 RepID=UPI001F097A0D|nr:type II secretion system protein [Bacillus piscicola]
MKKVVGFIKNQRGLTLIELLAVVVILGIIAAIAVPSIGGIINNSKKDAHIANAEQMVSAVRLAKASNLNEDGQDEDTYTLKFLIDKGFIESMESPSEGTYSETYSKIKVEYPKDDNPKYKIILNQSKGGNYIDAYISDLRGNGEGSADQGRDAVTLNPKSK